MKGYFSTAYLPPIAWFARARQYDELVLEKHESWQKQSYRSRCYILGPNGPQMLNIPILHNAAKEHIGTVEISYRENWQHTHWQAIRTAYGGAPFYEVLAPDLEQIFCQKENRLFDWNLKLLRLMMRWLQMDQEISFTESWHNDLPHDHREEFHPKRPLQQNFKKYPQVFDDQQAFAPNLSVLDLLMNEGPAAWDYLSYEP